jgi:hypothetical protein
VIAINLKSLSNSVSYLAVLISSFTGVGFKGVETASVTIMQQDNKILEIPLGAIRTKDNSVLVCILYRKRGAWSIYNTTDFGPGKVFTECEELIQKNLVSCGLDIALIQESKAWSKNNGKKFILEKE